MNREIKFRAISKETKKFVYGDVDQCDGFCTISNTTKIKDNEYKRFSHIVIPEQETLQKKKEKELNN